METFKAWILSICGATLVTSLCKVILSNSKIQKMTNVFLSIFVLLYTILPIKNINLSFDSFQNEIIDEDSYDLYYQEGYNGVNPSTGDKIFVEGGYKLRFNASKKLKDTL